MNNIIKPLRTVVQGVFLVALTVTAATGQTDAAKVAIQPDVVYGHKDGLALTMDVYRPADPNGAAILFMMSGGWFSRWVPAEQTQPRFQPYLDEGYTMMAVRHGSSPKYAIAEIVPDVRRAVRFVRQNAEQWQVDPQKLGVMGMSAGGHLSLMLGTTGEDASSDDSDNLSDLSSRVAAVVALVPPTDLRVAVWEAPESLPVYRHFPALNMTVKEAEQYSPRALATPDDAPALIIMGGQDELVPPKHGEWIAEALKRAGVEHKLIIFPDAGHGLEGAQNQQTLVRESLDWFDKYLLNEAK